MHEMTLLYVEQLAQKWAGTAKDWRFSKRYARAMTLNRLREALMIARFNGLHLEDIVRQLDKEVCDGR